VDLHQNRTDIIPELSFSKFTPVKSGLPDACFGKCEKPEENQIFIFNPELLYNEKEAVPIFRDSLFLTVWSYCIVVISYQ